MFSTLVYSRIISCRRLLSVMCYFRSGGYGCCLATLVLVFLLVYFHSYLTSSQRSVLTLPLSSWHCQTIEVCSCLLILISTNLVPVEGKSSVCVCAICMIILIIIITSLGPYDIVLVRAYLQSEVLNWHFHKVLQLMTRLCFLRTVVSLA